MKTLIRIGKTIVVVFSVLFVGSLVVLHIGGKSAEKVRRVSCMNNLHQLAKDCSLYARNNNGKFPTNWFSLAKQLNCNEKLFYCRSVLRKNYPETIDNVDQWSDYVIVPGLNTNDPPDTILAFELLGHHQDEGANLVAIDTSVQWVRPNEFKNLRTKDGKALTSFCR